MQDHNEIFELLDVEPGKITITNIQITTWGCDVVVECRYEGEGKRQGPFQLLFEDVRSIQWDVHTKADEQDKVSEVAGLFPGQDGHAESAIIYTDIFELTILYGGFTLVKDW